MVASYPVMPLRMPSLTLPQDACSEQYLERLTADPDGNVGETFLSIRDRPVGPFGLK